MQRVEQHLLLRLEAIVGYPVAGHGGADENLSIGESDHVGLGRIAQEIAVDPGHGRAIDEYERKRGKLRRKRTGQQRKRRLKPPQKRTDPHWNFVLLV